MIGEGWRLIVASQRIGGLMPTESGQSGVAKAARAVIRLPARVLAYAMKAMGRAYNKNYYPGAVGSLIDENAGSSRQSRRARRPKQRQR